VIIEFPLINAKRDDMLKDFNRILMPFFSLRHYSDTHLNVKIKVLVFVNERKRFFFSTLRRSHSKHINLHGKNSEYRHLKDNRCESVPSYIP